jgi:hypothetical protein
LEVLESTSPPQSIYPITDYERARIMFVITKRGALLDYLKAEEAYEWAVGGDERRAALRKIWMACYMGKDAVNCHSEMMEYS